MRDMVPCKHANLGCLNYVKRSKQHQTCRAGRARRCPVVAAQGPQQKRLFSQMASGTRASCTRHKASKHTVTFGFTHAPRMRIHRKQRPLESSLKHCRCSVSCCHKPRAVRQFRVRDSGYVVMRNYCKEHAAWFVPATVRDKVRASCGYVTGYGAAWALSGDSCEAHVRAVRFGDESGAFDAVCQFCRARCFDAERVASAGGRVFTKCCRQGKLAHIPVLPAAPCLLSSLLGFSPASSNKLQLRPDQIHDFRQNIRRYNASMAFAAFAEESTQTSPQDLLSQVQAPPVFVMHGRPYHVVGPLTPRSDTQRRYGQLYVFDAHEASQERARAFEGLRQDTLLRLAQMLEAANNPYPQHFRQFRDVLRDREIYASTHNLPPPVGQLCFKGGEECDPRRYNEARADEIAIVFAGDNPPSRHYVSVFSRCESGSGAGLHELSYLSEHVDPLTYPLIHVFGTLGYSTALKDDAVQRHCTAKRTSVSLSDFYCHRLMHRPSCQGEAQLPLQCGRLTQQYVVDAYGKIEAERLDWIRRNQDKLRVESLQGLQDHLSQVDAECAQGQVPSIGRSIILPATFGGCDRALHQCYLDAMALVNRFGKPDLFITMTASPSWPEIAGNLGAGEQAADRPDLVARVFHLKLHALLQCLARDSWLGHVLAYTYVVEYQKRGLPHAHILLILTNDDKPRSGADIDKFVSAEIPNPTQEPKLYALVNQFMVHGPCGAANPTCPCMRDGVCSKGYPKPFVEETRVNVNGYPLYRRRLLYDREEQPRTVKDGTQGVRDIVPYNARLLLAFQCHINVEICTSIKAVKYLYKYTYKGPDRAALEYTRDEIQQFLDSRWVGAPEAMWRILRYELHGKSHQVLRLPVHLPLDKNVCFRPGHEQEAMQKAYSRDSMLEAWFRLIRHLPHDSPLRALRYTDVGTHFTWNAQNCRWQPRQRKAKGAQNAVICRMYHVKPQAGELYFLRLLLLHVPACEYCEGKSGWHALASTGLGQADALERSCTPFRDACQRLQLLHDDADTKRMLAEAITFRTSTPDLLALFAETLVWLEVQQPPELWNFFLTALQQSGDSKFGALRLEPVTGVLAMQLYNQVNAALLPYRQSLQDFGVQPPECDDPSQCSQQNFGQHELQAEIPDEVSMRDADKECASMTLNSEQDAVFQLIKSQLDGMILDTCPATGGDVPFVHYLDGPGGSGKTYLYCKLAAYARSRGHVVLCVAMSGLAALLLPRGRTAHSRFRLPVPLPPEDAVSGIKPNSAVAELLRRTSLIIWDEAPTSPKSAVDAVDRCLRDVCPHQAPFPCIAIFCV